MYIYIYIYCSPVHRVGGIASYCLLNQVIQNQGSLGGMGPGDLSVISLAGDGGSGG